MDEIERLYKIINYSFADQSYIDCALTHRSAGKNHYERMEFLGDSVLSLVISTKIYEMFPNSDEGDLSRLRAHLVKGETLSELAADLKIGDFIHLGPGELKSGGFRRKSILADVFESIIGGIYLDGGIDEVTRFILTVFEEKINNLDPDKNLKDPKTMLQELLQSRGLELPSYEVTLTSGKDHDQTFEVECQVSLLNNIVKGVGASRRKAEQAAAKQALQLIEI